MTGLVITLASLALASLVAVTIVYGILTAWWKTRTGIGFLSMMASFTVLMAVTLVDILFPMPLWPWLAAWALIIVTVSGGVLWNIIYKQFIQKRPDLMGAKPQKESHV